MRTSHFSFIVAFAMMPMLLHGQKTASAPAPLIVPAPATTLPLKLAPRPTTSAITAADLMTRLYIFADDSMMGREAGTIGNLKATDYIAAELKRLGLTPAGDNGSFFQTIPFKTRALSPSSVVKIGDSRLNNGVDWAVAFGSTMPTGTLPVVFGGTIGDGSARLEPAAAAGKMVIYRVLPSGMGQVQDPSTYAAGSAAIVLLGLDQYIGFLAQPSTFVDDPARKQPNSPTPVLLFAQSVVPQLFDGPASALKPGVEGHQATMDVTITVAPVDFPARNVLAILPCSDARLMNEYIAIGAHNDHIGFNHQPLDHDSIRIFNHIVRPGGAEDAAREATAQQQLEANTALAAWRSSHPGAARADSISNGADDDGSGSVTVLEIAEHFATLPKRPKRSVLFVWHVGEEKGLLGSQYFTDHPTVPRDSIVAQLNIDMVGRGDASDVTGLSKEGQVLHGAPNYLQLVGSRRLSSELGDLVEQVNTDGKLGLTIDYSLDANNHPMNIYCRSDHYSYARYGIPVVFFTTGGHSDYHQVTDEPQYIDYPHMARVAQLVASVALHAANLDHRVAVDKPKPDPAGACKQ